MVLDTPDTASFIRTVLLSYRLTFDNFCATMLYRVRVPARIDSKVPVNAHLVALRPHVKPLKSIRLRTRSHLTPLESHSCTPSRFNSFRITFLRKNRGGGGHSVNYLPGMEYRGAADRL